MLSKDKDEKAEDVSILGTRAAGAGKKLYKPTVYIWRTVNQAEVGQSREAK